MTGSWGLDRRAVALAAVAAVAGAALLVLWIVSRSPAPAESTPSAPTLPRASDSVAEPSDEDPGWTTVAWERPVVNPFGEPDVLRRMDGLVATTEGYLAWGRTPLPGRNQFNDMGAIFLSADGTGWQTIAIESGVNAANASTIHAVAEGPEGFLAVGSVCCDPEQPAVWLSPDGVAWTRAEVEGPDPAGAIFQDVVAVADGWVALGSTFDHERSVTWFTRDGTTWEAGLDLPIGDNGPNLFDIAPTGEGVVVVGFVSDAAGSWDGAVWWSDDGRAWEQRAADDAALTADETRLSHVVAHAGGLLATGITGTAEERRVCEELTRALVASLAPVRPPSDAPDALSCAIGQERQWRSPDGDSWELVELGPEPRPIEFRLMAAAGPGLILLGESSGAASPDTTLFASADGARWQLFGPQPMLPEVGVGLAVRGAEILAITEEWSGSSTTYRVWRGVVR